jgi:hypothetical protein
MRHRLFLGMILVLLSGVLVVGASVAVGAQNDPTPAPPHLDVCAQFPEVCVPYVEVEEAKGESEFGEGATAELLGFGVIPALPSQPAALALQRVQIAPGGSIVTPADDPRVVLLYVERGTLTVRNTVATTVTRGTALATPGAQAQEAIPAGTEFTMTAGDSSLSPAGSGGELRNDGTEDVVLLAGVILPIPTGVATPTAGTPVP